MAQRVHCFIRFLTFSFCLINGAFAADVLIWPTNGPSIIQGKTPESFIQDTGTGKIESGLFGCFRNNGSRFHEGIDIKASSRNRKNESTNPIYAAMDGEVAYVNKISGNSAYGRYIVLVHTNGSIPFYSLYAHLSEIDGSVIIGKKINKGATIGVMGRSASYKIPKERAHLHFEMGLQLSSQFHNWYAKQQFDSKNHHGNWNGMNLHGFDPLDCYYYLIKNPSRSIKDYILQLKTAFSICVKTNRVPAFIRKYNLMDSGPLPAGITGWEIEFTWYGLPKKWKPLTKALPGKEGSISILQYDNEMVQKYRSRKQIRLNKKNQAEVGKNLQATVDLIFGY